MTDLPQLQSLLVGAAERRVRRRRMRGVVRFAAVAAVAGAAVFGVTRIPVAPPEREVPAATPTPTAAKLTTKQAVEAAYAVFRRPAGPEDRLDTSNLPKPFQGGTARLVAVTADEKMYLILRGRTMCTFTRSTARRGYSGGCGPARTYLDGHKPMGSFNDEDGPSQLSFVFPDGVDELTLSLADGSRTTYPVRGNVFIRSIPARAVVLEWRAPDGQAERIDFPHAPAARAQDFYRVFKRTATPADELDGLADARLVAKADNVRAWLVPRLGSVCLVVRSGDTQASGCRHKVGDVRRPLIVGFNPNGAAHRVVAIAFPQFIKRVETPGSTSVSGTDALLLLDGDGPRTLRYVEPGGGPRTDRFPAGGAAFTLHARPEAPTAIAAQPPIGRTPETDDGR